jgi:dTDP-4-dehydrorhamnose 3,5-epimerase-like enzyme
MSLIKRIPLHSLGDERGQLISLEENKNIPFAMKRVYYIFNTQPFVRRGLHAHKKLEQLLICTSGSCSILLDDGQNKQTTRLDAPHDALFIGSMIWREMYDFSADCVLMVVASDYYDEADYIRDYDVFLNKVAMTVTSV